MGCLLSISGTPSLFQKIVASHSALASEYKDSESQHLEERYHREKCKFFMNKLSLFPLAAIFYL